MYRVVVDLACGVKRAQACSKATVLKQHGSRVEALVNDVHEILVLEY